MPKKEERFDLYIDALDVPCPIPSMRVRMNIRKVPMNGILKVSTNAPHSFDSIPRFCRNFGHKIITKIKSDDGSVTFFIQRKGERI